MFDGHHKQHALAYLGIIGPDGMILWSAEPESGRRNDNFLVNINNLIRSPDGLAYDSVMERLHRVTGKRFQYYGDSAFANTQYSQSAFSQTGASQAQLHYNNIMNSVRVSIENVFGFVISKPAWCDYHKNQKLLLQHVGERESFSNAAFAGRTARTVNLGLIRPYTFSLPYPRLFEATMPRLDAHSETRDGHATSSEVERLRACSWRFHNVVERHT